MIKRLSIEQVQQILLHLWDPIGVGGIEACADEYDSYAADIYDLLQQGQSRDSIQAYLVEIETDFMDLEPNHYKINRTLDALFTLLEPHGTVI